MKRFVKVCYTRGDDDPGVIEEHEFRTEAEAQAFIQGWKSARDRCETTFDLELEDVIVALDDKPAMEEA